MLQFDEYKVKLNNLLPQLDDLEQALNLDEAARQVDFLEAQCAADGFWDNPENSQKVLQKLKQEKNKLESQAKRRSSWDDMMVLCEMGNEEEDEPEEGAAPKRNGKVVNIHATTQLKVVLVKPEHFEDASTIADHLNNKRTVVLNLESTNKEVSRRLVDFLSGVAYANNGQIKRVANSTFIITPYNVDIMGDLLDELENNGAFY